VIRAIVFDLDNTLVDFMSMKKLAVEAAIDAMIDAGLTLDRGDAEQ
jgi:FMN phosphatase YigB (HAD superfamily)